MNNAMSEYIYAINYQQSSCEFQQAAENSFVLYTRRKAFVPLPLRG